MIQSSRMLMYAHCFFFFFVFFLQDFLQSSSF